MIGEKIASLVRSTSVFGVSGVLSRVSGLITFPILTKAMGAEQFGVIDYYLTIANFIAVITVFGLDSVGGRFYFQNHLEADRRKMLSQVMSLQAVPVLLLFVAGLAVLLAWRSANGFLLALVLWQAALAALISHLQYFMIWRDEKRHYMVSTIGTSLLTMAVLVWACIDRTPTAVEVLAIFFGGRLATVLHGLWVARGLFAPTLNITGLRAMLTYGWPIGVVCTLNAMMPFIERQSILSLISEADLGIYAAATRIAILLTLPIAAFQIVWVPFAFSHFRDPGVEGVYRAVFKLFAILGIASALAITALSTPLLLLLTTPEFIGARAVVFPICFALVVKGLGDIAQVGIDISFKSHLKLIPFGLMAAVALVVTPLLARGFGIQGVAWGMVMAFATKGMAEYRLAKRAHPLEWHGSRVAQMALIACAFGASYEILFSYAGEVGTALTGLGATAVLLLGSWFILLDAEERSQLLGLVIRTRTTESS
jgi:O-antigen/teichoic acid export membrane protein